MSTSLFRNAFEKYGMRLFAAVLLVVGFIATISGQTIDAAAPTDASFDLRVEKVLLDGGAEILTIVARPPNKGRSFSDKDAEIPLLSILIDTLGDKNADNDQIRYVWVLTYTRATFRQKAAAFVPFLYMRTGNKKSVGTDPPPPVIDLKPSDNGPWSKIFRLVFRKIMLGQVGVGIRAPILQYQQNSADYRRAAVARALAVLSLYQPAHSERLLGDAELKDIQARLWLTDKYFGWHMQSENLTRVFDKEITKSRDLRNQNWELLRQYSEEQGLYFDPLEMPDGSARHAIVWVDAADIKTNANKKFDSRFLNIKTPWTDPKLLNWKGHSQVRWFDDEDRQVPANTPNARSRTLIPLAVYGLDFPKIPVLLVDFRDSGNVKKREMSKRVLNDITVNLLSLGPFSSVSYFLARFGYDYVTGKRGMDINQASRLRSYSQLKLLLSLDTDLDKYLRDEIADRLEHASLNPLENDLDAEAKLARSQYANLIAYAKRPNGLPAQLEKDRREEMVKLVHSGKKRALYSAAHFFSFGLYTKRENMTPELMAKLDIRRQLDRHERFLRETAFNSAKPEVDTDVEELRRSLQFVSENGAAAKEKTTKALARIFSITDDEDVRRLCVTGLYRINNAEAKKQLLAIYANSNVTENWRDLCAHYLKLALEEGQQISTRDARTIAGIEGN